MHAPRGAVLAARQHPGCVRTSGACAEHSRRLHGALRAQARRSPWQSRRLHDACAAPTKCCGGVPSVPTWRCVLHALWLQQASTTPVQRPLLQARRRRGACVPLHAVRVARPNACVVHALCTRRACILQPLTSFFPSGACNAVPRSCGTQARRIRRACRAHPPRIRSAAILPEPRWRGATTNQVRRVLPYAKPLHCACFFLGILDCPDRARLRRLGRVSPVDRRDAPVLRLLSIVVMPRPERPDSGFRASAVGSPSRTGARLGLTGSQRPLTAFAGRAATFEPRRRRARPERPYSGFRAPPLAVDP